MFLYKAAILLSIIALVVGFAYVSQATLGVAIIGAACALAIYGRIGQSRVHHEQMLAKLSETQKSQ